MEQTQDYQNLIYANEILQRQKDQVVKDIKDLKERIELENKGEEFIDQLYVSHQTVQPVPNINFSKYLQFCQDNHIELSKELIYALEKEDETKQSEEYKELERLLSKK
ncbi:hypothetical protein C9374_009939 [Naegleria lovaniensis]|uniref:Uncharacterized protein n=1 Tax=Naegleria lovaniensis TaxID=51637 RepID=A0AA88GJG7_NAELO|nr:uncharacterized protein C9374_009939 [Naegleria lovaniensis]KAG2375316.1 hypothetical protein C9374_009939 [Naegleria lovaniensis]